MVRGEAVDYTGARAFLPARQPTSLHVCTPARLPVHLHTHRSYFRALSLLSYLCACSRSIGACAHLCLPDLVHGPRDCFQRQQNVHKRNCFGFYGCCFWLYICGCIHADARIVDKTSAEERCHGFLCSTVVRVQYCSLVQHSNIHLNLKKKTLEMISMDHRYLFPVRPTTGVYILAVANADVLTYADADVIGCR